MLDGAFALHAALGIQHAHVMTFTTPIDADIKGIAARWHPRFLLRARPVPWGSLDPVLALTAQTPHWSFTTACRTGAQVRPRRFRALGPVGTPSAVAREPASKGTGSCRHSQCGRPRTRVQGYRVLSPGGGVCSGCV